MLAEFSDEVGRKLSNLQDEVADVRSHTSERFVRVVQDVGTALDDLRGTAFDLGVQLQASQHDVANCRHEAAEAERRAVEAHKQVEEQHERSFLELRQQLSEMRLALKAGTEHTDTWYRQQSEVITRQSEQLASQLQDCKDVLKDLISCSVEEVKDGFLEQLMKLRIKVEEQERSSDTTFKAIERDARAQRSELLRLVEDRIETASRQDGCARQEHELKIRQAMDTIRSSASDAQLQVGKAMQEMDEKMQNSIETVRSTSAEGLRQLGKTVREAENLAATRHDEIIARHTGLQAQVNEIRAAELALANESTQGLEFAEQRLAEKLRSEVQILGASLHEAKESSRVALDRLRADINETLQRRDSEHSESLKTELRTVVQHARNQESKLLQTLATHSREASDVSAEIRKKSEDYADKAAVQLRDLQASLQALVADAKAETQQQLASETRNIVAELELTQGKRLRELNSLVERERLRSEELWQNTQALLHENSKTVRASIEDNNEKLKQRLQQHEDSAKHALSAVSDRIANQQASADKNSGNLREEFLDLSKRLDEARQLQSADINRLEEFIRTQATNFSSLEKARHQHTGDMEKVKQRLQQHEDLSKQALSAASDRIANQQASADKNNGLLREEILDLSKRLEEARQLHSTDINRLDEFCRLQATNSNSLEKARHQHAGDMEKLKQRLQQHEDSAKQTLSVVSDRIANQQALADKNNAHLRDELLDLSKRLDEARQSHSADIHRLDDFCRAQATNFSSLEKARHQHTGDVEKLKQRLQQHEDSAKQTIAAVSDRIANQQALADKNNGLLREEFLDLSNRLDEAWQLHSADINRLDESCRTQATNFSGLEKARHQHTADMEKTKNSHDQLQRRVQAKEEQLQSMEDRLSTCKEEWKGQHAELEAMCRTQREKQKEAVDKINRRQERFAEALAGAESKREKQAVALAKTELQQEKCLEALDNLVQTERRVSELEDFTGQRLIDAISENTQKLIHQELNKFQHDSLSALEWKIERCVQWLHGASVKLGLNPSGTMFHADRFRDQLFSSLEESRRGGGVRSQSARSSRLGGASGRARAG